MGFSSEDWLIIDETLNAVARELEKIIQERKGKEKQSGNTSKGIPTLQNSYSKADTYSTQTKERDQRG